MSNLEFNEERHEYILDGKKLISVTQLLQKHGIAPSYDTVDRELLRMSAERGTMIHEEIAQFVASGERGFSIESSLVADYFNKKGIHGVCEQRLHNDILAGIADFIGEDSEGKTYLIDFKTGNAKHLYSWSWQVALYEYLYTLEYGKPKFDNLLIFHLHDSKLDVLECHKISTDNIEALLIAERNGDIWGKEGIVADNVAMQLECLEMQKAEIERQLAEIEEQEKELKRQAMEQMESKNVKNYSVGRLALSYVAPSQRKTLDSKKLATVVPNLDEYYKVTQISSSLRIKLNMEDK